jgi:hypothetical protein
MHRQRWFEIHDQPWFPAFLRDLVTESLEAIWNANRTYSPIAARLREAVRRSGAERIVDLCSGGGGPWAGLYDDVADGVGLAVWLTDFYPNALVLRRNAGARISAWAESVDARHVPAELRGFRTIFSSFHHFDPDAAGRHCCFRGSDAPCMDHAGADGGSLPGDSGCSGGEAVPMGPGFLELRNSGGAGGAVVRWGAVLFAQLLNRRHAGADARIGSSGL